MTQVDVVYRYGAVPTEAAVAGIARLREVYGIRRVEFREVEKTVRVEYDSTRLTEPVVQQLLRRGGLDVEERVVLWTVPEPPPEAAPPAVTVSAAPSVAAPAAAPSAVPATAAAPAAAGAK